MKSAALLLLVSSLAFSTPAIAGRVKLFEANCARCHQRDAKGVAELYPPLAHSIGEYLQVNAGRAYLVHVVSFGLSGPISVHGRRYNRAMKQFPDLSDAQVAQVLNEVLTGFNRELLPADFVPFTAEEVRKKRAARLTPDQIADDRDDLMRDLKKK